MLPVSSCLVAVPPPRQPAFSGAQSSPPGALIQTIVIHIRTAEILLLARRRIKTLMPTQLFWPARKQSGFPGGAPHPLVLHIPRVSCRSCLVSCLFCLQLVAHHPLGEGLGGDCLAHQASSACDHAGAQARCVPQPQAQAFVSCSGPAIQASFLNCPPGIHAQALYLNAMRLSYAPLLRYSAHVRPLT